MSSAAAPSPTTRNAAWCSAGQWRSNSSSAASAEPRWAARTSSASRTPERRLTAAVPSRLFQAIGADLGIAVHAPAAVLVLSAREGMATLPALPASRARTEAQAVEHVAHDAATLRPGATPQRHEDVEALAAIGERQPVGVHRCRSPQARVQLGVVGAPEPQARRARG